MIRLLIVDDDHELTEMLTEYLATEGFAVTAVHNGPEGLTAARDGNYDLILLDVMLPGMGGFEVLRGLRSSTGAPVLMLTARGDDVDTIVGLELGADDYLPKPFNPRLLVARLRALLRRGRESKGAHSLLEAGDVVLDPAARRVTSNGAVVELTSAEFVVLAVLLRSAGYPVSRDEISRMALGRALQPFDRSVDMHVSNLRRKLGPLPDGRSRIETIRGAGYQYLRQA